VVVEVEECTVAMMGETEEERGHKSSTQGREDIEERGSRNEEVDEEKSGDG
jgi:hypothetical protein